MMSRQRTGMWCSASRVRLVKWKNTAAAVFFHFTNLTRLALHHIPVRWRDIIAAHGDGVVLAVLAAAAAWPAAIGLRSLGAGAATIGIAGTVAGLIPAGAYAWWRSRRSPEWRWLIGRLRELVSKKAKRK